MWKKYANIWTHLKMCTWNVPWVPPFQICKYAAVIYASAPLGGANTYMFYSLVFSVFCFFSSFATTIVHKYETIVLGNGWTDFHETFTKRYRGKWSFQRRTQMGARPPNFLGLKTEKSRKDAIGVYSSELITPERKRISERLKRLWNHKTTFDLDLWPPR